MRSPETPPAALAENTGDASFRLLSIRPSSAPRDSVGRDWLEYRIGQGPNMIKGYRRGELQAVRAEVEKIVIALNERRRSFKAATPPKRGGARAAPAREPQESDE